MANEWTNIGTIIWLGIVAIILIAAIKIYDWMVKQWHFKKAKSPNRKA